MFTVIFSFLNQSLKHILEIASAGSFGILFSLTMESLFSPCTRLRDRLETDFHISLEELQELNLDVPTEELLSARRAFAYADLYAMLANENAVLWLTPHAAVMPGAGKGMYYCMQLDVQPCRFSFSADGKVMHALASSPEHLLEISDVVIRLLAASVVHSVRLGKWDSDDYAVINAPTLEYLMEKCQGLKDLSLEDLELDKNHCRVLGADSRSDLEIVLGDCRLTSAGTAALTEVLGRNQGPTKLDLCYMDNSVLANGLRGNSRLKSFEPRISMNVEVGKQEVLAIACALKENKGLVDLDLRYDFMMSNETWDAVCDSLKTHPTLQFLDLRSRWAHRRAPLSPAMIKYRLQALVGMLKVNVTIHTMNLGSGLHDQNFIYRGSVIPYLATNKFRPCLRAIQKTLPLSFRAKVLGRALLAVRTNANSLWMLLSGNAEVAFPSTIVTATLATNLPTPATAEVTVAAIRATSTTGASSTATASVAPPTAACQKRKAHS
jgi:hypothetical protein